MEEFYFTITGTQHYFGHKVFKAGALVLLAKESDNPYDDEAIRVDLIPVGCAGYVANSSNTVIEGTYSAGRLYDHMGTACFARVMLAKGSLVIARLESGIRQQMVMVTIDESGSDTSYSTDFSAQQQERR